MRFNTSAAFIKVSSVLAKQNRKTLSSLSYSLKTESGMEAISNSLS